MAKNLFEIERVEIAGIVSLVKVGENIKLVTIG